LLSRYVHRKNDFEISKNLTRYKSKNNFIGTLKIMSNVAKNVHILATSLNILHIIILIIILA